jgi:hypothetical protein
MLYYGHRWSRRGSVRMEFGMKPRNETAYE